MNSHKTSLYSSLSVLLSGGWGSMGREGGVTSKSVPMATYRWLTSRWCSCRDNLQCVASLWELSEREEQIVGVCCRGCWSITPQTDQLMRRRKTESTGKVRGWRINSLNPELKTGLKTVWIASGNMSWIRNKVLNRPFSCKPLFG